MQSHLSTLLILLAWSHAMTSSFSMQGQSGPLVLSFLQLVPPFSMRSAAISSGYVRAPESGYFGPLFIRHVADVASPVGCMFLVCQTDRKENRSNLQHTTVIFYNFNSNPITITSFFQGLGKLATKFPTIANTSIYCLRDFLVTPSPILFKLHKLELEKTGKEHMKVTRESMSISFVFVYPKPPDLVWFCT